MFVKKVFIVLSISLMLLHTVNSKAQVFQSTYGAPSNEPGFAAGMKTLIQTIRDFFHGGYGAMAGGPGYSGTFL